MGSNELKIVIVGGGIGGLFAANALSHAGLSVNVYEQAPQLGEIGAGVFITPNSIRHLERVGLGDAFKFYGTPVNDTSRYYRFDGTEIAPVQVTNTNGSMSAAGMHRADFVEFLRSGLAPETVHTGHRAIGFEQDEEKARVRFANGTEVEADIVIGADGIHSVLRDEVAPPSTPVFSGSSAYRGTIPAEALPDWPNNRLENWLGEKKHFLVFPVRAGSLINYVGFVPGDEAIKESWSAQGDPDQLRLEFAGWDPRITELLGAVEHTFRWALYDRNPLPVWTKGRLTLLGDAAHPMLPHLGQGANQAIEDGMALASVLAAADPGNPPAALGRYETLRRERVAKVQIEARKNGLRYDSHYSDLGLRDAEIRAHAKFRRGIYDYDVVEAVDSMTMQESTSK